MNILLLGSGGREHALAWRLSMSPRVSQLFVAPGNPGTARLARNVDIHVDDFAGIRSFVLQENVEMVVVGPELPLVAGISDFFSSDPDLKHVALIGPTREGAKLEGSKAFAKAFMQRHGIPTAAYKTFDASHLTDAVAFLESLQPPYVLKADGLCAGKGVLILNTLEEAKQALRQMLDGLFGQASAQVVIEEYLSGVECSVFVLTDGLHYKILPVAKDYKRIGNGDTGPNTGGMGSISPVPFANEQWMDRVEQQIVRPTINGLHEEGISYRGFIFLGLINSDGQPKVIEYNCRMGDPETQSVMLRLQTDLVDLLEGVANGNLDQRKLVIDPRTAACVVLSSKGYPGNYEKGKLIQDEECGRIQEADPTSAMSGKGIVFHAGTAIDAQGNLVTAGGRVAAVAAMGADLTQALVEAYARVEKIHFEGKYYRTDIGADLHA